MENISVTAQLSDVDPTVAGLELAMQELEALEAPGWWTAAGAAAGVVLVTAAAYASAAAVAT
jgi:hypothetical protein